MISFCTNRGGPLGKADRLFKSNGDGSYAVSDRKQIMGFLHKVNKIWLLVDNR